MRPLTVPERKYTYAQSSQLQGQTGNSGYLRGDFGSSGDQFYTTWFDNVKDLNITTFTFGEALSNLKRGKKVARKGWNMSLIHI